jgi:uncharacterized membrane protein
MNEVFVVSRLAQAVTETAAGATSTREASGKGTIGTRLVELAARIEQIEALDGASERIRTAVTTVVPERSRLKDLLGGAWLGHPLHPPLTDVVIGAWTGALVLDLVGGRRARAGADRLVGVGIVCALPTAATGMSDWAELGGGTRRLGSAHAIGNTSALVLQASSWVARRRGSRRTGIALSAAGYGIMSLAAWLGGDLVFRQGVGVTAGRSDHDEHSE